MREVRAYSDFKAIVVEEEGSISASEGIVFSFGELRNVNVCHFFSSY